MASRTKEIGTLTTLTLTAVIIWIALNQNFKLQVSGDTKCAGIPYYSNMFKTEISDCQIFFNITSINYTYYFKNKKGIALGFSPEINGYKCFVKDGRYISGYRLLDSYLNFTFTKGKKYEFMCYIYKEKSKTVKWSVTAADQFKDPILFGIDDKVSAIQECRQVTSRNEVIVPTKKAKTIHWVIRFTCISELCVLKLVIYTGKALKIPL